MPSKPCVQLVSTFCTTKKGNLSDTISNDYKPQMTLYKSITPGIPALFKKRHVLFELLNTRRRLSFSSVGHVGVNRLHENG